MDQKEKRLGEKTQERMEKEFEENRNKLGIINIIKELEREYEEKNKKY